MKKSLQLLSLFCLCACTHLKNNPKREAASIEQVSVNGYWSAPVHLKDNTFTFPGDHARPRPNDGWWVTPIHANLLSSGKILITGWSRSEENYCADHKGRQNGTSFILDPNDLDKNESDLLSIFPIAENPKDKRDVGYCSGHAPFPDGRILYTGGARYENLDLAGQEKEYGLNYARVFDPQKKNFSLVKHTSPAGPNPTLNERKGEWSWYEQGMMWYPTNTRLPNGVQLVAGGFAQQNGPFEPEFPNKSLALFDTKAFDLEINPWKILVSHEAAPKAMNIGPFDYPHSYLLKKAVVKNGNTYDVAVWGGQNGQIALLNTQSGKMLEPINGKRPNSNGASDKTSLLLPNGNIMVMGGGSHGESEGQRIDIYNPYNDSWESINTGITRIRPASTLLPDGTVLILSGEGMWDGGGPTLGDRKQPTLFDPAGRSLINMAAPQGEQNDRGYHNISLLLKDGRVLIGGGRTLEKKGGVEEYRIGCERSDIRIFSPPYLFKGQRPVIKDFNEGTQLKIGNGDWTVHYDGIKLKDKGGVVLMALGAETHHFDQNQRYVALNYKSSGDVLKIMAPSDSTEAPEGEYMLFLVSAEGTPSVSKMVRLIK